MDTTNRGLQRFILQRLISQLAYDMNEHQKDYEYFLKEMQMSAAKIEVERIAIDELRALIDERGTVDNKNVQK